MLFVRHLKPLASFPVNLSQSTTSFPLGSEPLNQGPSRKCSDPAANTLRWGAALLGAIFLYVGACVSNTDATVSNSVPAISTPSSISDARDDAQADGDEAPVAPVAQEDSQKGPVYTQALVGAISSKWNVSAARVARIVSYSLHAARQLKVDPLLVLSVVAQESGFRAAGNPEPGADDDEPSTGKKIDPMRPHGLMQVAGRWHADKFPGGLVAVTDDQTNILIGTRVLREYLDLETGDIKRALQRYNGNLKDATFKYSRQVLELKRRMESVRPQSSSGA